MIRPLLSAAALLTACAALAAPQSAGIGRRAVPHNGRRPLNSVIFNNNKETGNSHSLFRAPAADETLSMNWGYCEAIYSAIPMDQGELKGAIIMTPQLADEFAGAKLTSISIGLPADASTQQIDYANNTYVYKNPIKKATVWLSESLDKAPFASVEAELGPKGLVWETINLPEAYVIEKGKSVVIGYTMEIPEHTGEICPLVADYSYDNYKNQSCMVYTNFGGVTEEGSLIFDGHKKWQDMAEWVGNICIRAGLEGDNLPVNNAAVYDYELPQYTPPGEEFTLLSIIRNLAANNISSLEYTMNIQGMEPQTSTVELSEPLRYFEYSDVLENTFTCTTIGNNIPYDFSITAINGVKLDEPLSMISGTLLCIKDGYARNNVFEEATGTWCGWCVIGYAGMEYMAEKYAGKGFIGIGVHSDDPMDVMGAGQAYEQFARYVEGFPSAYLNRNMASSIYPAPDELEYEFDYAKDVPAYAKISATLTEVGNEGKLKLDTRTEFGESESEANYMVGYTVIEDEVGPYAQQNYCSGSSDDYYGFENKPAAVRLKFNEVARNCSCPMGVANSLPTSIEKGKEYEYTTEIDLVGVKNPARVRVVAMVINGNNGAIENAECILSPAYAAAEEIADEINAGEAYGMKGAIVIAGSPEPADVYTIDGRHVASGVSNEVRGLVAGIYIVVLDGKSVKVVVK